MQNGKFTPFKYNIISYALEVTENRISDFIRPMEERTGGGRGGAENVSPVNELQFCCSQLIIFVKIRI